MAQTDIQILLTGGRVINNWPCYEPHGELSGSVIITPGNDLNCQHVLARLKWHTEGRGDRAEKVVAEQDLFQGHLSAGQPQHFDFHFALPGEPWSYAGHYLSIVWEVEVEIDLPLAFNPKRLERFVLAPLTRGGS